MANDMHPNGSVWKQPLRYGKVIGANGEFMVDGDLEAAYKALKEMFEKPADTTSGPIKPLTEEERKLEDNKSLADAIQEMPPLRPM